MRLIGNIEVVLRNQIHRELSRFSFDAAISIGDADSNDWYRSVIAPGTKPAKLICKVTNGGQLVSTTPCHKVVAQMTYGFWPRLLQIKKTASNKVVPWDSLIPLIFSDHTKKAATFWSSQHEQDKLFMRLDLIGDLRNRVAHFEPVWKFGTLKDEWIARTLHPVTVVALAPATPAEAIARLRLVYGRTTQLLSWLSKVGQQTIWRRRTITTGLVVFPRRVRPLLQSRCRGNRAFRLAYKILGAKMELQGRKSVLVEHKQKTIGRYFSL
jgi:hypothetical protein